MGAVDERKMMTAHTEPSTDFGMDTISLAGTLPVKLQAMREAGFSQVMLSARDLVGHAEGLDAAIAAVRASGLRVTGLQVLRDFEGLSGQMHDYKVDIAKSMLELCSAVGADVMLVCSSTSAHASDDRDAIARDLRKLALLAIPRGIRIAYEALSWGRTIEEFPDAWDVVCRADMPNLGIGLDSFHMFATRPRSRSCSGSTRSASSSCSSPTSCGRRSVGRGTHHDRAPLPRLPRRGRAQRRRSPAGVAARTTWATAATTASRSSTTTTSRSRGRRRAARPPRRVVARRGHPAPLGPDARRMRLQARA
jgi:hypothetical protein